MPVDVAAHITGTVWEIRVNVGDVVQEEQVLVVLESMKMEVPVAAPVAGRIRELRTGPGRTLRGGDLVAILDV